MGGSPKTDQALANLLIGLIHSDEVKFHRVSRILHDDVGQVMSAVGFQLDALRYDLEQQAPRLAGRIPEIQELLEQAMQHVRDLSFELNPGVVEKAGLQAALDRLLGRFRQQRGGSIRLMFDTSLRVPPVVANALYKVAETGLANAVQHAMATQIDLFVKGSGKGASLEIRDNGTGFDVEEVRRRQGGLGLLLLDHYCLQGGLRLSLKSEPGNGTILKVTWQAREASHAPASGASTPDARHPGDTPE